MTKRKTVQVEIAEDTESLPVVKSFRALSVHPVAMGSLLDEDRFDDPNDGTAMVAFLRDDDVIVGAFFRSAADAERIIKAFREHLKSGDVFYIRSKRSIKETQP
jgi:hypothetical protein